MVPKRGLANDCKYFSCITNKLWIVYMLGLRVLPDRVNPQC